LLPCPYAQSPTQPVLKKISKCSKPNIRMIKTSQHFRQINGGRNVIMLNSYLFKMKDMALGHQNKVGQCKGR
jgi:ribosomal protein S8